jgi:predicted dehydrogenase
MKMDGGVRWGILGTARIARTLFLPSVREAGGEPAAVAGRDRGLTERWAADNGVARAITGYQNLIGDPGVDAVYIPLPNALHGAWTVSALRAGQAVLCEKPLTASAAETEQVLGAARETGVPLWEAFAFPFHDQLARLRGLLADGVIGDLREIQSDFHFVLRSLDTNIRMLRELGGGALLDVGCYPVRLARDLFGTEHRAAWARAERRAGGVDLETWGCLDFPGGRHLYLSCGFSRASDTFTRLLGTGGQIQVTNPYHPAAADTFVVYADGRDPVAHQARGPYQRSFTPLIRHVQAVLRGAEPPRLLAVDTAQGSARALDDLAAASQQP